MKKRHYNIILKFGDLTLKYELNVDAMDEDEGFKKIELLINGLQLEDVILEIQSSNKTVVLTNKIKEF
jgi:hypothetical protein